VALDTRVKRLSMLNYIVPQSLLPDPSGSFDQGDRQTLLDKYSGILFAGAPTEVLIAQSRATSRFVFSRVFGRVN
jgi:hypothetical protein